MQISHLTCTPILKNHPDQKPQIEPLESTSLRNYIPLLVILIIFPIAFLNPFIPLSLPPSLSRPSSLSLVVRLWQGFINLLLRELREVKLRMSPYPSHLTCCYGAMCQVVPGDSPTTHVPCVFLSVLWVCQLLNETCRISHAAFTLLKIQCVTVSMEPLLPEGFDAKRLSCESPIFENTQGWSRLKGMLLFKNVCFCYTLRWQLVVHCALKAVLNYQFSEVEIERDATDMGVKETDMVTWVFNKLVHQFVATELTLCCLGNCRFQPPFEPNTLTHYSTRSVNYFYLYFILSSFDFPNNSIWFTIWCILKRAAHLSHIVIQHTVYDVYISPYMQKDKQYSIIKKHF